MENYLDDSNIPELVNKGLSVLQHQSKILKRLKENAYLAKWELFVDGDLREFDVAVINSPYLQSELGAMLMSLPEFSSAKFAASHYYNGEKTVFSLRSCNDRQDVSVIAKLFGGGHRNASGCAVDGFTNKLFENSP